MAQADRSGLEKKTLVSEYFLKSGDFKLGSDLKINVTYPLKSTYGETEMTLSPYSWGEQRKRCPVHIGDMSKGRTRRKTKL